MQDRGYMLLFGGVSALLYVGFAFAPIAYGTLLVAVMLLTASFLFVASAQNGLTATLGQQHAMTGQISAAWNVFLSIPTVAALLAGGALSGILEDRGADQAVRILFLVGAVIMFAVMLYSLWKPAEVFDNVLSESTAASIPLRILRGCFTRPIFPALLIWLLWNFAPARLRRCNITCRTPSMPPTPNGASGTRSSLHPSSRPSSSTACSAANIR